VPPQHGEGQEDEAVRLSRRNSIKRRLAQFQRRVQTSGLYYLRTADDEVVDEPKAMAEVLSTHWKSVFQEKPIDDKHLKQWFDTAERHGLQRIQTAPEEWKIRRQDIARALSSSTDTRPGPDGIPYKAWRALGDLSTDVLWEAAVRLEQPLIKDDPVHAAFNGSIMCCLPKASSSVHEDGKEIHRAHETRPLTIADCSNRLIANGYRYRWEYLIEAVVDVDQRGFLPGRSMLENVVDIEHLAMIAALSEEDAAMILFDFSAAFPSISRKYMQEAARQAGLPQTALQVIDSFYFCTTSRLMLHGHLFNEIEITAGIRQGCPLSPLLFALATDSLMKVIRGRHPSAHKRAFADDTSMVLRSWKHDSAGVFRTFEAYGKVSNLALNYDKTIVIPLWRANIDELQVATAANRDTPQIRWALSGKYLGYFVGPHGHAQSWAKPCLKFRTRLQEWDWSQMGLHVAMDTYGIYVASVLAFVAQLQRPPAELGRLEAEAVRKIAPGPGHWCSPADLKHGPTLGLQGSLRPLREMCEAAMLRTLHWEAHMKGGIAWDNMRHKLRHALLTSDNLVIQAAWADWFRSHAPSVMLALRDK
jgi:hypothetical protein